jgi:hypothetical protein
MTERNVDVLLSSDAVRSIKIEVAMSIPRSQLRLTNIAVYDYREPNEAQRK